MVCSLYYWTLLSLGLYYPTVTSLRVPVSSPERVDLDPSLLRDSDSLDPLDRVHHGLDSSSEDFAVALPSAAELTRRQISQSQERGVSQPNDAAQIRVH